MCVLNDQDHIYRTGIYQLSSKEMPALTGIAVSTEASGRDTAVSVKR